MKRETAKKILAVCDVVIGICVILALFLGIDYYCDYPLLIP